VIVRVLGIDPGSHKTGWGLVDLEGSRLRRFRSGVIDATGGSLAERLAQIYGGVSQIIASSSPEAAALESVFSHRNPRSAILLGHARGAALAACGVAGLSAAEYAPTRVKLAVSGYGRADKAQVQRMVERLLGLESPLPSDEADALAVSICHSLEGRLGARTGLPAVRIRREPRA
jgi:crossover junction endodeoxyribonuclease RuvC